MQKSNLYYRIVAIFVIITQFFSFAPAIAEATPDFEEELTGSLQTVFQPLLLSDSLSLSRVQSSNLAGTSTITFTLTNNLPPTLLPDVPGTATITDTVDILASFVITDDVNTLSGITLVDTLVNGTTLVEASGSPVVNGSTVTWNLPDLPPQETATISMTVQTPAQSSDFLQLDSGAAAEAEHWGNLIGAVSRPATLIPSGIDPAFTLPTVDANSLETDMLWKSAGFTQDPLAMFAYVQSLAFEPYKGSLRGTRGTLWGEAGNAVDQSSLLIAMLRAAGVPARYRHGALGTPEVQTLIESMFSLPAGVAGLIPAGTPVSDPLHDPDLLALVSDHWWVEAYLPGSGWTDLDPSFTRANPGDSFATPGENDRISALPDNLRHKVTFKLEVEQYNQFPIGGIHLVSLFPVDVTFNTVELASRPMTFGHLVDTEASGGVYTSVTHTYTPYFTIEGTEEYTLGNSYQDLLTNFPLASVFTTAAWLTIETQDADGNAESFVREVKDLLGKDVRLNGGNPVLASPEDNAAAFGTGDAFVMWFLPNATNRNEFTNRFRDGLFARGLTFAADVEPSMELFSNPNPTPEEFALLRQATLSFQLSRARFMAQDGLDFAQFADLTMQMIEDGLLVKMFYSQPRIITLGVEYDAVADVVRNTLDLRTTRMETIVYPGQAQAAAFTANWLKGISESYHEGQALERFTGATPITTARIFEAMVNQGIEPLWITPATMALLDSYPLEKSASAYAVEALMNGKNILIPSAPVFVDGEYVVGWWEIDPHTGETISVMENGLHPSALEWTYISIGFGLPFTFESVWALRNSVVELYDYIVCHAVPALSRGVGNGPSAVTGGPCDLELDNVFGPPWPASCSFCGFNKNMPVVADPTMWLDMPAYQCPVDNCGVERFLFGVGRDGPIPLPEMAFTYRDKFISQPRMGILTPVTDGGGGGAPEINLSTTPGSSTVQPEASTTFDLGLSANFSGDVQVTVYAPKGWTVFVQESGPVEVFAPPSAIPGDYTITLTAQATAHPEAFDVYEHTATVSPAASSQFSVFAEPLLTVPMGDPVFADVSNQTNDAETEVENAAYVVEIWNQNAIPKTYDVTVSGASGAIILNGAYQDTTSVTLAPGDRTHLGLYVAPRTNAPFAPGTSYNLTVNVSDGDGFTDSDSFVWTMPSRPFNFIEIQAATIYLGSESTTDFSLALTSVGNGDGAFPISAVLPPISATVSGLPASVALAEGETQTLNATLETTGLPPGSRFPLVMGSQAPGSYTQYALAEVLVISDVTEPIFRASDRAGDSCTLGEPGLSDALQSLALSMVHLEASCLSGDCNPTLRDQTVAAAYNVVRYSGTVSPDLAAVNTLVSAADDLAAHSDNVVITNDLQAISDAVVALDTEVCAWSQHKPALRWTPGYGAALAGDTADFTLDLTNEGISVTTYALTVTLPSSVFSGQYAVNPGETNSLDFPVSGASIGLYNLDAEVAVVGQSDISAQAAAKLNVVDKFVQVTAVNPDPNFVETGASATTVNVEIANIANIVQDVTAQTTIYAPGGEVSYQGDMPLAVLIGALRSYELQTVNTSGWAAGVYTVSVELLDSEAALIPDGAGYGFLGVGQAIGVSHAVKPTVVAPGTVTVSTIITTELLVNGIVTETLASGQVAGSRLQVAGAQDVNQQSAIFNPQSQISAPNAPLSTYAITRTEDVSASIIYTGSWATVNNILSSHASNGTYTWSDMPGDTATFEFSGTWVHLGFITERRGGQAEIWIDGINQGPVDLYAPGGLCYSAECLKDVVYRDLADTNHTLEIVVTGNAHPNAIGAEVRLDHIDTWDGTAYPDGTFEQDDSRIWRTITWAEYAEPAASGGSYMNDGGIINNGSVWFPFTGDSASFVALARYNSHRVHVWVDGAWQGDVLIYSSEPISRTFSFSGFGPGPHIMRVSAFREEPNIDAFITPAVGPDYEPPAYTGLIRYEEDHPALRYNGYPVDERPNSWAAGNAPQASEFSYMQSSTISDTVSLTFDGSWLNIGLRTRTGGGLAEVLIDGTSYGTIDSASGSEDVRSYPYDLITGTHVVSITVLGATYLDYLEIWDSTPVTDTFQNAARAVESGRIHISSAADDGTHENAIQGDYVHSGLSNSQANVWYSFVGDAFTFYGLTDPLGGTAEVYVDGALIDTVDFTYPFSVQPIAYHYSGFGPGAHAVRVHNVDSMQMDGFASNPSDSNSYQPIVEWWDDTPAGNGLPFFGTVGIAAGMAAGDLNGDGDVEIVVTADDVVNFGSMFVYRGDGQDTGDGDPIIWMHDFGGGSYRTWVSTPALADLDGQPGAEIVVAAGDQLYAFQGDGSTYWITDTVSIFETLTAPAIGNLDLDPEPEIVVNAGNFIEIRENDGTLVWSDVYPDHTNPPILADLTGDGLLDILVTGWDSEVRLYEYNFGSPVLAWTQTLSSTMDGTFGAPAVADIDGMQPGGDPGPEVAVAHNGALTILNGEDGAVLWSTPLDPGNPGGVSIAELDGDGEIEIVTGMLAEFEPGRSGMLYALNADGSLLWEAIAEDNGSANNASTLDLNGDGIYEIAWNGEAQGFTIFNGPDGSILFSEPLANSATGSDYPLFVDTDNDNQAEVVVAALRGLRVFGYGSAWGEARPLWNQHSYHISNVYDNLTIPFSESNSWEIHNTYRTQWPARIVLPVFAVSLTHTVALDQVTVLTDTFNLQPPTSNHPHYGWDFSVSWESPVVTQTFQSQLDNLQPGETRLVAQGTAVDYTTPGGQNRLQLPPLYVTVPHIVSLNPSTMMVGAGATAIFLVELTNPTGTDSRYTLSAGGLPSGWVALPEEITVPAGSSVNIPLTVTVPTDEAAAILPFNVAVTTDFGAADQTGGTLTLLGPLVEVGIMPHIQDAAPGSTVTYTLTITNLEGAAHTYDLSSLGLASVNLPAQIAVGANSTASAAFTAQAAGEGANPFTVVATTTNASGQATASVIGAGFRQVSVGITPWTAPSGPGVPTPFTVMVTNLGTTAETFDLDVDMPAGWATSLRQLGNPVSEVLVAPGAGNAVTLQLLVTPPNSAVAGDYGFSVTAQADALVRATSGGTVGVGNLGVEAAITSGPGSLPPDGRGTFEVAITNTGQQADTYDLSAFGPFAPFATLSQETVTLNPGASQTVQMTVNGFDFALAGDYGVGLHAQSQTQSAIENADMVQLTVTEQEGIELRWLPATQAITGTSQVAFTLMMTNTGNVNTTFDLSVRAMPGAGVEIENNQIFIPLQATVVVLVWVDAPRNGVYTLTATADSGAVQASEDATLTVSGLEPAMFEIYLPLLMKE